MSLGHPDPSTQRVECLARLLAPDTALLTTFLVETEEQAGQVVVSYNLTTESAYLHDYYSYVHSNIKGQRAMPQPPTSSLAGGTEDPTSLGALVRLYSTVLYCAIYADARNFSMTSVNTSYIEGAPSAPHHPRSSTATFSALRSHGPCDRARPNGRLQRRFRRRRRRRGGG